jgi:hypothetical protein
VGAAGNIVCHDCYPPQQDAAPGSPERSAGIGGHGTDIKNLASIRRHRLRFRAAMRTGDDGFKDHGFS